MSLIMLAKSLLDSLLVVVFYFFILFYKRLMFVNTIALEFSLGGLQAGRDMLVKAPVNIHLILNIRMWVLQRWQRDLDQLIILI